MTVNVSVSMQETVMEAFFEQETRRVVFSAERAAVRAAVKTDTDAEAAEQPKVCHIKYMSVCTE